MNTRPGSRIASSATVCWRTDGQWREGYKRRMTKLHHSPADARRSALSYGLLLASLAVTTTWASAVAPSPNPFVRHRQAQAACMSIRAHGDRADCLSEASTALAAALPPVPEADPMRYARNAIERCKPLRDDDQKDCLARMAGQGTTSGSVAGGGMYRELITREAAPASVPAGR